MNIKQTGQVEQAAGSLLQLPGGFDFFSFVPWHFIAFIIFAQVFSLQELFTSRGKLMVSVKRTEKGTNKIYRPEFSFTMRSQDKKTK
ncbi:MAG: hypothetical protein JJE22_12425 [Bacteroidia bacterium]|nr:hypothetical protein [Bacteroidia bacterium]